MLNEMITGFLLFSAFIIFLGYYILYRIIKAAVRNGMAEYHDRAKEAAEAEAKAATQTRCQKCGKLYDEDFPRCPQCGYGEINPAQTSEATEKCPRCGRPHPAGLPRCPQCGYTEAPATA